MRRTQRCVLCALTASGPISLLGCSTVPFCIAGLLPGPSFCFFLFLFRAALLLFFSELAQLLLLFFLDPCLTCRLFFKGFSVLRFQCFLLSANRLRLLFKFLLLLLFPAGQRTSSYILLVKIRGILIPVSHGFFLLPGLLHNCRSL